jgi:hypothetical protein
MWMHNNDGANYLEMKFLGYPCFLFCFSCVVAVVWVMEREELKMKIRGKVSEKLSTKVFSLRKVLCCGWQ